MDHRVDHPPGATAAAATPSNGDERREMCSRLYRAAHGGRAEEVMALLHGAGPGHRPGKGIIQHGQCDLLEVTAERNTVLHVAAEQGHGNLIQEMHHRFIKDDGFLSRRNSALDTPLHCAARAGHASAITVLVRLSQDCGENILGCQNGAGDTAVHLAARHGHGAAVEALAAAGSSASELNNAGMSALYLAVMSRSVPAVRAIINSCRDASSVGPSSQNALHAAVFQSSEMVHLLLEWKPELAVQVDCNGSTPLHFAASDGNRSVVKAILRDAPPSTVYMKDTDGLSALHVAARQGHHRVVKKLMKACPDAAELRDVHGDTFLHAAVRERRSSVVSLAIKNPMLRGLLNAQDGHGNTPLHLAVVAGAPRIVDALLQEGKAQTDVLNDDGHAPLDLASESTGLFNMVSYVVILAAFGAHARPQRKDHLKPWSDCDIGNEIHRTSDSLAVVAVLIATVAFAAGFNMPGGYSEKDGTANLKGRNSFKWFVGLDAISVAASVLAVLLLVYGKASRSSGSWKSIMVALNCIWISLVSLVLAFYAASRAVMTGSRVVSIVFLAIYLCLCLYVLMLLVMNRVDLLWKVRIFGRFLWPSHYTHAIKRQHPFASVFIYSLLIFLVINIITFVGISVMNSLDQGRSSSRYLDNISPAPAPM